MQMSKGQIKILVIGATGQIGSELVPVLRKIYGEYNVIATGTHKQPTPALRMGGPFIYLDAKDIEGVKRIVYEHNITHIFHLASILSANGEKNPEDAWRLNIDGLRNVLEVARMYHISRVIWPSSIAVFGPSTPRQHTPDDTVLQPTTMYGITKVAGELLLNYYYQKYGVDGRSLRLPGIISSETLPGGGTTDYAVEIFYEAIRAKFYKCFLAEGTKLPMLYMPDCIDALIQLMEADPKKLTRRTYNVTGMSFTPAELAKEIRNYIPEFKIEYNPDFRQAIADSWPESLDDSNARQDWGWNPKYDVTRMSVDMLAKLEKKLGNIH
jgi:nucleoside-diphosphate-sugar epimerase